MDLPTLAGLWIGFDALFVIAGFALAKWRGRL
jgi:hypothetical protein